MLVEICGSHGAVGGVHIISDEFSNVKVMHSGGKTNEPGHLQHAESF